MRFGIESPTEGACLPCAQFEIPHYTAYKATSGLVIDGKPGEDDWKLAKKSTPFRDLITGEAAMYDTRMAILWDDEFLYVAYWIEEPNLQATLKERDAPIWSENDVELFVAGKNAYYELEINAYGTLYEALFIWKDAYVPAGYDALDTFSPDQPGSKPFNGVGYRTHPRGSRIGFFQWDFLGLISAVHLEGTLNNASDQDKGWTVELALPWSGMKALVIGDDRSLPPKPMDVWRMDFSRFNQYKEAPPAHDSGGWAWSPHGVWDSHIPECFAFIYFSDENIPGK